MYENGQGDQYGPSYQSRTTRSIRDSKSETTSQSSTTPEEKSLEDKCKGCSGSEQEMRVCEDSPTYCYYVNMLL